MADEITLNTEEKMAEARDKFGDSPKTRPIKKGGKGGKSGNDSKHKKGKQSFDELSALPEPTARAESNTQNPFGPLDQADPSTTYQHGGRKLRQYRMSMVGYSRVGKTALCAKFCDKSENDYVQQKENLFKKKIDLPEMPTFRFMLDILDTQGAQEVKNREIVMEDRYRKRTNHIMLFVYSITKDKSFKFLEELLRIENDGDAEYFERMGVIIVGNKVDLEDSREVETEDARDLARDYGAAYFETSAKTGHNVEKAFYESVRKYHEKTGENEETMEQMRKANCCQLL